MTRGAYLGEVHVPPGVRPGGLHMFVDGRLVVAVVEGPDGTIMVKRYRLVIPE